MATLYRPGIRLRNISGLDGGYKSKQVISVMITKEVTGTAYLGVQSVD